MDIEQCLVYPALQKFYNSLSYLVKINPEDYIFENIPKNRCFFSRIQKYNLCYAKTI